VVRDLKRRTPNEAEADTREPALQVSEPVWLMVYVPLQQQYTPRLTILARAADGRRMASEIRKLVTSFDSNLPVLSSQTLDAQSGPGYLQLRIAASVAGSVGLVGLLLAAVGIYGVTAYTTARRTREIGIRIAMGAHRSDVLGMVLRQGMSLVVVGSTIGLTLAAAASRLFARMLVGLPPLDAVACGGAVMLFAAIGLAACYIPARRATQVDAMQALRYD
jgi:ABC-type antimicrobial peptide transport system permease subunit